MRTATILCCLALASCAGPEPITADQVEQAASAAEKHMAKVAAYLATVEAAADDLLRFQEAVEAGELVSALSELRGAVDEAAKLGLNVPDEVRDHMAQAELILALAGQR